MAHEYGSQEEINLTAVQLMHEFRVKCTLENTECSLLGMVEYIRRFGYKIIRVGDGQKDYQV